MSEAQEWPILGMTVDEAAQALRVDRKTIFQAIREDGFPARKLGKGWRICPEAVKVWLSNGALPDAELLGELVEAKKKLDHERGLKRTRDGRHRAKKKAQAQEPEPEAQAESQTPALDDQLGLMPEAGPEAPAR